ncbi:hypothetical protein CDAR_375021 [Caerostris darwini]|uniref:Uncharacterized protein n=1 Tax=Caerostris darwini TaxID=1538125 RepID=A0AAV4RLF0_9ARAC|nr:hypothetical protein CDAR_375021 [Caerostris darwini]
MHYKQPSNIKELTKFRNHSLCIMVRDLELQTVQQLKSDSFRCRVLPGNANLLENQMSILSRCQQLGSPVPHECRDNCPASRESSKHMLELSFCG